MESRIWFLLSTITAVENSGRISVKLPSGKSFVRNYLLTDSIRVIYAAVVNQEQEAETREFELHQSFPRKCLGDVLDLSIGEAGLKGTKLIMIWK